MPADERRPLRYVDLMCGRKPHLLTRVANNLGAETVIGNGGWMDDVILHDGPIVKDGHIALPDKPGCGIELNPDVVKAHLASGEKYWS